MFFDTDLSEWEKEVLKMLREVWGHGEGEVTFRVVTDQGKKRWKADKTLTTRWEDKIS